MNTIDILLLLGTLAMTSALFVKPQSVNSIFLPLLTLVLVLAMVQFFLSGYYWQLIPAYLLLLLLAGWAFLIYPKSKKIPNKPFRFSLLVLGLATLLSCSVFLPVPRLTEPIGNFQVGTRIFRWIDFTRTEQLTADPDDKRNVIVQAWYPAEPENEGKQPDYLDGMEKLPAKIGGVPSFLFDHFDQIDTYGKLDVPISKTKEKWPVILFLNGNGTSRSFYTSLVAGLASFGYVVLTIDHPYEAVMTQLANGELVTPIEVYLKDDPDLLKFMENRLDTRVADIQFVLTQLDGLNGSEEEFFSKLDLARIGIAGHSLGGASAGAAMAVDTRIKAAANIDGTLYGELPKPIGPRPFLLLECNKDDKDRYLRYEAGNQIFFRQFGGGFRFEISDADHYSFTDAPLFLAFPARFLASRIFGIGNIPRSTHHATVDMLNNFFEGSLYGNQADLDSIAGRYQGIIRKPVE